MSKKLVVAAICVLSIPLMAASGCEPSADNKQRDKTEKMLAEADMQIGMPGIRNFKERRMMKMLYELRDTEVTTYTYIYAYDGSLSFLCNSLGYGLPYATQFINPQKIINITQGATMPQAEPNGLFMPNQADATWVMCVDPADKKVKPLYVEPRVIVSPFQLKTKQ